MWRHKDGEHLSNVQKEKSKRKKIRLACFMRVNSGSEQFPLRKRLASVSLQLRRTVFLSQIYGFGEMAVAAMLVRGFLRIL